MCTLLAACQAQMKVLLTFDTAAPRDIFVASAAPKTPPQKVVSATGTSLEYTLPAFGPSDNLYVWNHTTNNIAVKPIKEIAGKGWAVKPTDDKLIGAFTVRVERKGQAVQAAKLNVSAKGRSEERLIDPSAQGEATFFGYPLGDISVKVGYNTTDQKAGSEAQIFPEGASRGKATPVLTIALADDVATVAPAAPAGKKSDAAKGDPEAGQAKNPAGTLVMVLAALVLVGGIGYWVLTSMKNHPKVFEEKLAALGVQIPKPQDPDDAGPPIAAVPIAPAPPPSIVLDDGAPTPLALGLAPAPIAAPTGEPTLLSETGGRAPIPAGDTIVGREEGLGLSLVGETTVSRRHAQLTRADHSVVLTDLGSTNGTFVNGIRLQGEATLKPGDHVQFGSVKFRFEG